MPTTIEPLLLRLKEIAEAEGGPMFMGRPDRWWDAHLFRCVNDHVSRMVLRCEEPPYDRCLACGDVLTLTFPEDRDGPLVMPAGRAIILHSYAMTPIAEGVTLQFEVFYDGTVLACWVENPLNHWIVRTTEGRWTEGIDEDDVGPWQEVGFACIQGF